MKFARSTLSRLSPLATAVAACAVLSACGGGVADDNSSATTADTSTATAQAVRLKTFGSSSTTTPVALAPTSATAAAQTAAAATASHNTACQQVQPFYWEIGDRNGKLAGGSVDSSPATGTPPTATTRMNIASASKWLYAAYAVQKYGADSRFPSMVPFLNFTSGYSNFDETQCNPQHQLGRTVAQCDNGSLNTLEQANHTFHYNGGHMQQLALNLGQGSMTNSTLAKEVNSMLGSDVGVGYSAPEPEGGVYTTASNYAVFLRKLLNGNLKIATMLDADAVCTQYNATSCPNASSDSKVDLLPPSANFHYGLGHWIEDDASQMPAMPGVTTANYFAYSSAGTFGFYPWVSTDRTLYGIVARQVGSTATIGTGAGYNSLQCGRLIRLAWTTGVEQTEVPSYR
jgi:CubicO group peptidase (beta-lactamase class C family)